MDDRLGVTDVQYTLRKSGCVVFSGCAVYVCVCMCMCICVCVCVCVYTYIYTTIEIVSKELF